MKKSAAKKPMGYAPRITLESYVSAMLRNDNLSYDLLPPRTAGCYTVWYEDFFGDEPQVSDMHKIVWVGKAAGLLYRVTQLVVEAIGITDVGNAPGAKYSYYHVGGRSIFLKFFNTGARKLLVTWRDDVCPSCEEHRIYTMYYGGTKGSPLLNRARVPPCKRHKKKP